VRIVSATNNGNGTWTVVTDPGLYLSDWSAARGATLRWNNISYVVYGMAMEDMTVQVPDNGGSGDNLQIQTGIGSWLKGLRIIGPNNMGVLINHNCFRCLVPIVRPPPRSGWLGEWGRLKGGCPVGLTRRAKARLGG